MFLPRAEATDSLYLEADIGKLRLEARREINRLIQFLDKADNYASRELEDDDDREEVGDDEPTKSRNP
jgi:DNA-dependent RNA polymerase auxiliary subunit epsilon